MQLNKENSGSFQMELQGACGKAKVFTNNISNKAIGQLIEILNQPWTKYESIRIMPDVHPGKGAVIGTTLTIADKVVPNLVGVDINCGVTAINLGAIDLQGKEEQLEQFIKNHIPFGFEVNDKALVNVDRVLSELKCFRFLKNKDDYFNRSLGSTGGGNHFVEIGKNRQGEIFVSVHSGSRNLGGQIAKHYQKLAYDVLTKKSDEIREEGIKIAKELKEQGRQSEIEAAIAAMKKSKQSFVSKDLAYLEGDNMKDYLYDTEIAQWYADLNRELILKRIAKEFFGMAQKEYQSLEKINCRHNYIDFENMILRKGAISAQIGEKVLIPMNMRDGILVCIGKGNCDWNFSAPHGAGRLYSRGEAKEKISLSEFEKSMEGICSSSVGTSTIDESPMAYKSMEEIVSAIGDTVAIIDRIVPIINVKSS